MQMGQYHYLPLAPGFFAILVGLFLVVMVLRSVRFAYESLGVSSGTAMWLLFAVGAQPWKCVSSAWTV